MAVVVGWVGEESIQFSTTLPQNPPDVAEVQMVSDGRRQVKIAESEIQVWVFYTPFAYAQPQLSAFEPDEFLEFSSSGALGFGHAFQRRNSSHQAIRTGGF